MPGGWYGRDAAPDLLAVAKVSANSTDKMICLRGYLRLAGLNLTCRQTSDLRCAVTRFGPALAQKDDEKKLLLAALSGIPSIEALDLEDPT